MNAYIENAPRVILALIRKRRKTMLASMRENKTPFQMLIATILSARAKDEVTSLVAGELFKKYPDARALAKANPATIKRIIKRIGFYNHKTKMIIASAKKIRGEMNGRIPETLEELQTLPGVGMKVAKCILVYAHGIDAIPADTHVHRIANRLGWVRTKKPDETSLKLEEKLPKRCWRFVNEVLVMHGKTTCFPRNPNCGKCAVRKWCAYCRRNC